VQVIIETKAGPLDIVTLPGETILAAGLRQGVPLPYECATGTCGTCRARLIDGEVGEGWPQAPGRQGLKPAHREFLMCQAAPLTDCLIAVPDLLGAWRAGAERPAGFTARIGELAPLTHDMLALSLVLDRPMAFEAGQFVLLAAPGTAGFRAYSMANWEEASSRQLDFIIKRKPDGRFSDWLFTRARQGDALALFGPLGSAVLEPALGHDLLVAVGGSGLAVALSILRRAADEGYLERYRARLFVGVRAMRDTTALREISLWRDRFGTAFEATVALSEASAGAAERARWPALRFEDGMVHEVVGRGLDGQPGNTMAFLAGPPAMVDATLRVMMLKGRLSPSRIRFDKFS
jgi:toluene monooxygenase electron transfer component